MKKLYLLFLTVFVCIFFLYADLNEEVLFISSLYEDAYYDLALREIAKIEHKLTSDRYSNQILLIKADILLKKNQFDEAKTIMSKLNSQSLSPEVKAQVLISLATVEKLQKNYNEAHDLAQLFISRFPNNRRISDAYQLLGEIYLEQGNYSQAENIFQSLHENNNSVITYQNLINIQIRLNNFESVENLLEELKIAFPKAVNEHQVSLLMLLNAYEKQANYLKIIDLTPDSFTAKTIFSEAIILKKISALINLKNYTEAESLLSEISDDVVSVNYYRAVLHKERSEDYLALPIFKILAESETNPAIRTMSFFNMVQIIAKTNSDEAYSLLQNFLIENPDQEWEGDILYQLGFLEYQNRNYQKSYDFINSALNFSLNNVTLKKALYLKAELEFLLEKYEKSFTTFFENYTNIEKSLKDEAVFKLALNSYFLALPDSANKYLNKLISEFPHSQKIGVAYFYLGELALLTNLSQARSYYQQALSGTMDQGVIYLRLAYTEYLMQDFGTALDILNLVPDTNDYLYDKSLLRANILFAQKDYNSALDAYRIAERNASDQVSVEYIWSRQAWTYYNLKYYDAATAIYRRLATQSDSPGKFVLSAAGAAFNADNFQQALDLYREYIESFPNSPELYKAQSGLANCYFNLAQYDSAIDIWQDLVQDNQLKNVIDSSLKGLQASYQKLNRNALFSEFLNLRIIRSQNPEFIINLYEFKSNFEYEQKNYTASIATINQMLRNYPDKKEDQKIMILLANNYTWLKRYEEADQIYVDLALKSNDPYIYYEWGHIKWAQRDFIAALRRYKRAVENSRNEQYWLTLLERIVEHKDSEFMKYYEQFVLFASPYHKSLAMMNLIDWLIHTNDFEQALEKTDLILETEYSLLRAKATFKKGEITFLQKDYSESLTNFLKIRYIFNEFSDIRWTSELYIAKIYIAQGEVEKAKNLFNSIKANLSPAQISEFNSLL